MGNGSGRMRAGRLAVALALLVGAALGGRPAPTRAAECANMDAIRVPGAELQVVNCLDDLTTRALVARSAADGYQYTVESGAEGGWAGLHALETVNPSGVPGIQVDGYFPDTSTFNTTHGWDHDAQFVIRLPDDWNGKLVITGAPGVRRQYSNDVQISDWMLAKGYAFASTDKGNSGAFFFRDGQQPGDAIVEWHERVRELTVAAKEVVGQRYGRPPTRTYMTGISNGGYLTRVAIETHPELYDGAVDWEGVYWSPDGPNLLTYLVPAVKYYPVYKEAPEAPEGQAAHDAMIAAGFEPGSEFLWPVHHQIYWDLTLRIYREEVDPEFDGPAEPPIQGPWCTSGETCEADYDYGSRPPAVRDAVARIATTGNIGKPTITIHGTWDTLLPIKHNSDVYAAAVDAAGRAEMHRYYVFEAGNHVDFFYSVNPATNQPDWQGLLRPLLPCYRAAFEALERWVETPERQAPPSGVFPKPVEGDLANTCTIE
jgi:pimeloyl-ACP methyl ester carboxylesterase